MATVRSYDYNPYYIVDERNVDDRNHPVLPLFLTEEFKRDIQKVQTLKVFKVVLSSFLCDQDKNYEYSERDPNIYDATYGSVRDVIKGRAKFAQAAKPAVHVVAKYRYGQPFDGNLVEWQETLVQDDVIKCHYYNPMIIPPTRDQNATEVIYFLYDIVRPLRDSQGNLIYTDMPERPEIDGMPTPDPFWTPVYETVEANKIAAIGRTRGVDDQIYNYTHAWYYFDLQGFELKCRFKIPKDLEDISGVIDNSGNTRSTACHHHTTCAVVYGAEKVSVPDSRPPNMRDAHDRLISDMQRRVEVINPRGTDLEAVKEVLEERRASDESSDSDSDSDSDACMILPDGRVVQVGDVGLTDRISYAAPNDLRSLVNRRLVSEDFIADSNALSEADWKQEEK